MEWKVVAGNYLSTPSLGITEDGSLIDLNIYQLSTPSLGITGDWECRSLSGAG
jgi:hypothetical protein